MQVLEVIISVAVNGANEDILDVVDTCLIVHILLEILLCIRIIRVLNQTAVGGNSAHSKWAGYRDLFHFTEIPKPDGYLCFV